MESDEAHAAHVFGFAALYRAWQACRRGKRGTRKAQRYETQLLDRLVDTRDALQTHAWHPSRTTRFVTLHPKPREILAADFGDRVVHHLLVPWLERLYEPVFIHDSYANRKGKGTHAAVQRLQTFTRSQRGGHYLQLDIANFFHSVDRRTLYGLLQARVQRDLRQSAFATGQGVQHANGSLRCPPALAAQVQAVLASYFGHLAHAKSRNAQAQVFARHPWLAHWLQPVGGTARLRRADQPAAARSLASQWRWLQKNYPGHALLVQVGTHWECAAGPLAGGATRCPGLPPTHTVPAARLPALRRQLMRAGQPWVEMAESGHLRNGRKRRQVQAVWSGTQNAVPCAAPIQ